MNRNAMRTLVIGKHPAPSKSPEHNMLFQAVGGFRPFATAREWSRLITNGLDLNGLGQREGPRMA